MTNRGAGVYLHPTSFPSRFGIGDFGENAFKWIDMLKSAKQTYWQFSPLGPTDLSGSPYQSTSSFAGNPLLISPQKLFEKGLLAKHEIESFPHLSDDYVDYINVTKEKEKLFVLAFKRFKKNTEFFNFCEKQKEWLEDFSLFCTIKKKYNGKEWLTWDKDFKLRNNKILERFKKEEQEDIDFFCFLQFVFFEQCKELREYAKKNEIKLIGDIPIYVSMDSVDAWTYPNLFEFDEERNPLRISGVPPDYYSKTGQLWGNPLYRWDEMKKDGYKWWIARIKKSLEFADIVRIDHFRAFEAYWAVKAGSVTAIEGEWVKGPGYQFFEKVKLALGELPFIAEDLGVITKEVEELREQIGIPGMKVLQFAFDGNKKNPYLPYNISFNSVIYTGTHDNDTTAGWLDTISGVERRLIDAYIGHASSASVKDIIRLAYSATSKICIIPLQDILGLDSKSRMNTPGKVDGNWQWRCNPDLFKAENLDLVKEFAEIYGRTE
jgi:4-alpha-glucanotransferase